MLWGVALILNVTALVDLLPARSTAVTVRVRLPSLSVRRSRIWPFLNVLVPTLAVTDRTPAVVSLALKLSFSWSECQ